MPRQRRVAVLFVTMFVDRRGFGIVDPVLPRYADRPGAARFDGARR